MELDQQDTLVEVLAQEYEKNQSWQFLKRNHANWSQILIRSGLITPRKMMANPPPGLRLQKRLSQSDFPINMPQGPGSHPPPDSREIGSRLSLFDSHYQQVMGKNPKKEDHSFRPIFSKDMLVGYLGLLKLKRLSNPLDVYYLKQQKKMFYVVGGLFLVASVLVSFLLAKLLLRPIRELSLATRSLAKRQFDTKLRVRSSDELGQLTIEFNRMVSKLGAYELRQKQWLSDISHELRTPIAILIGEIDAVQDGIRKPDPDTIQSLQSEALHLKRLVEDLHMISMSEAKNLQIKKEPVEILKLLDLMIDRFSEPMSQKGLELNFKKRSGPKICLSGDPDRLIQLFSNVLKNSLEYTNAPGRVSITYEIQGSILIICFDDTAPSVPDHMLKQLFDRLFRVDSSRSRDSGGSGLGLAISKNIIQAHSGEITARKSSLGGLQIRIELPLNE